MTVVRLLELDFPAEIRRRTAYALLGLLVLWAFGLRLWYATPDLNSTRFWDERYGLENLEPLLKEGQLRPVHGFHPGFSYLPHGVILKTSDLVSRATGWQALAIFDARGRYTPTAYMICRSVSVVFGTVTLILLYLIGVRMGGRRLGLLAAFLLSVVPWHLRQSVLFKADITLLFTVVLTFYLSLRALDRRTVRSFTATGVAIGLALSSKFNAGPVAIPLTVGAFLAKGSKRQAFWLLAGAAIVSVLVFFALQPFILIDPDIYRRSMGSTARIYEKVAAREGHGRLYLFWHLIITLLSDSFHGPWIGALALIGLASVAALAWRLRHESRVALPWLMALSYIVAYTLLYALATPRPSPHNWLPVTPFAALGAAWSLLAGWLWLTERSPSTRWRLVAVLATGLLVGSLAWRGSAFAYRETVPSTGDRVLEVLRSQIGRPDGRHVITEYDFGSLFQTRHRRGRLALNIVDALRDLPANRLNMADAEVFPGSRLAEPTSGDFYRQRMERLDQANVVLIEPGPFRAWGPALVALIHPWRLVAETPGVWSRSPQDPLAYTTALPAKDGDRYRYSIVFTPPRRTRISQLLRDGEPLPYVAFRGARRQMPLTTTRLAPTGEIRLTFDKAPSRADVPLAVRTWRPGRKKGPRQRAD
jgi:hypothetical protein